MNINQDLRMLESALRILGILIMKMMTIKQKNKNCMYKLIQGLLRARSKA